MMSTGAALTYVAGPEHLVRWQVTQVGPVTLPRVHNFDAHTSADLEQFPAAANSQMVAVPTPVGQRQH